MGIKLALVKTFHKVSFAAREHSPELLLITAGFSIIGSVVMSCKATIKFQDVIKAHNEKLDKLELIAEKQENGTASAEIAEIDVKSYRKSVYFDTAKKAVKLYAPGVLLMIGGFACCGMAAGILKKRFVSMAAAYSGVLADKEHLEDAIEKKYGSEELEALKTGSGEPAVYEVDENGDAKEAVDLSRPVIHDAYAKIFDESNPNWEKDAEKNRIFLQAKQNFANMLLQMHGYLFLNDVYEMLGFEKTQAGQIMGWKYYKETAEAKLNGSSNYVDFGIFNVNSPRNRAFVNGYERNIILDFNVDKLPILDRIGLTAS